MKQEFISPKSELDEHHERAEQVAGGYTRVLQIAFEAFQAAKELESISQERFAETLFEVLQINEIIQTPDFENGGRVDMDIYLKNARLLVDGLEIYIRKTSTDGAEKAGKARAAILDKIASTKTGIVHNLTKNIVKKFSKDHVSFEKASVFRVELNFGSYPNASFDGARIYDCIISKADLDYSSFVDADLRKCSINANLTGSDLTRANCSGVIFSSAVFNSDYSNLTLEGTNLTGAQFATSHAMPVELTAENYTKYFPGSTGTPVFE